jgi:hypothetical protein
MTLAALAMTLPALAMTLPALAIVLAPAPVLVPALAPETKLAEAAMK